LDDSSFRKKRRPLPSRKHKTYIQIYVLYHRDYIVEVRIKYSKIGDSDSTVVVFLRT
jgi:hypothetical protein